MVSNRVLPSLVHGCLKSSCVINRFTRSWTLSSFGSFNKTDLALTQKSITNFSWSANLWSRHIPASLFLLHAICWVCAFLKSTFPCWTVLSLKEPEQFCSQNEPGQWWKVANDLLWCLAAIGFPRQTKIISDPPAGAVWSKEISTKHKPPVCHRTGQVIGEPNKRRRAPRKLFAGLHLRAKGKGS